MRSFMIAVVAALTFVTSAGAAVPSAGAVAGMPMPPRKPKLDCNPAKSKPCGNVCIAKSKVCHVR